MPTIEKLVKLYTLPDDHGHITAFDSYRNDVFVGTSRGYLFHLAVEGLEPNSGHAHADYDHRVEATGQADVSLFTTLAACVRVARDHSPILQIQHSRLCHRLLVLCDGVLSVWRSAPLEQLSQLSADVGLFFLAPVPRKLQGASRANASVASSVAPASTQDPLGGGGTATGGLHTRTVSSTSDTAQTTTMTSSSATPTLADDDTSHGRGDAARGSSGASLRSSRAPLRDTDAPAALGDHRGERLLMVPRQNSKLIKVADIASGETVPSMSSDAAVQTFVLPEPIVGVFGCGEALCVRTRRQCSVLIAKTGASRQLARFRSDETVSHPAMTVCADTSELCLAHRQTVLRGVSLNPHHTASSADHGGQAGSMASSSTEDLLQRCHDASEPVRVLVARYPYLFAFTEHTCDVISLLAGPPFNGPLALSAPGTVPLPPPPERLAVPGILYSSPLGQGENVFLASKDTVWMMSVQPLRCQLAQLVQQGYIEEAFHVLQQRRRRRRGGDGTVCELESVELELHILAGFAYLRGARPREALIHLAHRVDPRDVILHVPDCIPPGSYSHAARDAGALPRGLGAEENPADASDYWCDWQGPCPYNSAPGQLQKEWLQFFEQCPATPTSTVHNTPALQTSSGSLVRRVPVMGPVTAALFLETTWEWFKDAIVLYLRGRLRDEGDPMTPPQRRSVAYALLVLMLERQDHRGAYQVVANDPHLALEDAYDLLATLKDYRLLALLLFRKQRFGAARDMLRDRVYISSYIPCHGLPSLPTRPASLESYAEACWTSAAARAGMALRAIPAVMRCTVARQLRIGSVSDDLTAPAVSCEAIRGNMQDTQSAPWMTWYHDQLVGLVAAHGRWLQPSTTDDVGFLVLDSHATDVPGSLAEAFCLLDHMNLAALQQALQEQPHVASARDEEGCTLLHAAAGLLNLGFRLCRRESEDEHTPPLTSQQAQRQCAILDAVLAAVSVLVDCGCPVNAVNLRGQTVLDVVMDAVGADGGTACLDVFVAALTAMTKVNAVATVAVTSAA